VAKRVLWSRGRVACRSLCCLGFEGMLVCRVGILSVLNLVFGGVHVRWGLEDGWKCGPRRASLCK
jgi:hypothetical protein